MIHTRVADRPVTVAAIITVLVVMFTTALPGTPEVGAQPAPAPSTGPVATELAMRDVVGAAVPRTGGTGLVAATVANAKTGAEATHVTVRYLLPVGTTLEPAVAGATPGCVSATGIVSCDVGTLTPGASTKVAIGVRVASTQPATLTGSFLPPRSDQFDPSAGEVLQRTWYHEADREATTVQTCWPVEASSIRLTECDGTPGPEPLVPDEVAVLDAFPGPFLANVTRSWEWRARIRPALSGAHLVCASGIDDGGYVAIAPAGQALTSSDVVLDVPNYNLPSQATVQLEAGAEYDVLIRVVNRGPDGPDNGGQAPGGWGYVGVLPAVAPCSSSATLAFGTAQASLGSSVSAPVRVAPAAAVRVTGTVTDGAGLWSQAQIANDGPDAATVNAGVPGQTAPVPPVPLTSGAAGVVAADIAPGTLGVIGQDPWIIGSDDSLPPQP